MSRALTEQELKVLRLLAKGIRNKQIALELGLSEQTIKNHFASIFNKMRVNNRTGALVMALHKGYVKLEGGEWTR